ncbi:zinc-ribbon domain-containing protein [Actinoplanes bogorensis]|uniref:Zinc-ribbon domain-containing protein n=1 Tax=Paractinoplanes bogorensis TaxID=1610840 RepID=A0ABS5YTV3_9ACTN|nr:zinc-ribbon domain-containing protein [Actinoplanes bogorensis]MBU2666883.1 zinc-ribbon domain-containing protein [Actinoplanes bogorensis]
MTMGAPHAPQSVSFCTSCGTGLPDQAAFCPRCGSPALSADHTANAGFGAPPPAGPPGAYGPPPGPPPTAAGSRAGVGVAPSDPVHWLVPTGRSWQSIASGYLGLFGLFIWILGPFALGLGIWAVVRSLNEPGVHGRGRAIFGIVAGVIGTLFMLMFLASRAGLR